MLDNAVQTNALGTYDVATSELTGDLSLDCLTLVERYERRLYKIPDFQRDPLLWPEAQRRSFVNRLRSGPPPIGTIVIFVTRDDDLRQVYLLDGLQRLSTMWEFYRKPEFYGIDDPEIAKQLLHSAEFPVQRRTYDHQFEAYADFLRLQANLVLTAYESYFGRRSLLPQWSWFGMVEGSLHGYVSRVIAGYGIAESERRSNAHNYLRHNLGMFLRYATSNLSMEPWQVTGKAKQIEEAAKDKAVEVKLAQLLNLGVITFNTAQKYLNDLCRRLDNDFAVIDRAWKKAKEAKGLPIERKMEVTLARFLQECGIFAHLNGVNPFRFETYAMQLLMASEGRGQIPYANGSSNRVTLGLGKLGRLADIARHTIVEEDIRNPDDKSDKSNGDYPIGRGQERGHLRPKSLFGPGPTEPEPASLNRSKGNRHDDEASQ